MKVELTSRMATLGIGVEGAAALMLAGRTAGGSELAALALYVWLAGQD